MFCTEDVLKKISDMDEDLKSLLEGIGAKVTLSHASKGKGMNFGHIIGL
jgi:hypothetical protein